MILIQACSCLKWKRVYQSATQRPAVFLLLSSSSSPTAGLCPHAPERQDLCAHPDYDKSIPKPLTVKSCRGWNGDRWLPDFAVTACALWENAALGDVFNSKTPHFTFRWKEEDKGGGQRREPCLEWGSSNPLPVGQKHVKTCRFGSDCWKACSDDISPLPYLVFCWHQPPPISGALSCPRCWSLTWREHCWTLPPASMWLWKTTRPSAKISKCGSQVRLCATRRGVMKEKMFACPRSSLNAGSRAQLCCFAGERSLSCFHGCPLSQVVMESGPIWRMRPAE